MNDRCCSCGKPIPEDEYVVHWGSCGECFDKGYEAYLAKTEEEFPMKVTIESGESKFVFGPTGLEGMPAEPQEHPQGVPADCCSAPPQFSPGDTVMLASEGPSMTVADVGLRGDCWCRWMDGETPREGVFQASALVKDSMPSCRSQWGPTRARLK